MGEELLANPGFEDGPADRAAGWTPYGQGYDIDPTGGRGGSRALRLVNEPATAAHGALQVVTLDQVEPRAIYLAGWSRAEAVTGTVDGNFSVYLDLRYTDGTPLYGQRLDLDVGTRGWQRLERFIVPAKPVERISVYCLLRHSHGGTAWFDDLTLREAAADVAVFDGLPMAVLPRPAAMPTTTALAIGTRDGLALGLGPGGAVRSVTVGDVELADPARDYLGGVLVRDVAAGGDVVHVGGLVVGAPGRITQTGHLPALGLTVSAAFQAAADRISVSAVVTDTRGVDRAIGLYVALPLATTGLRWFHDFRGETAVAGRLELLNAGGLRGLGATGRTSQYPWAAVGTADGALAIAVPLDQPRVMRLVQNPSTGQLMVAFDLGLAPETAPAPGGARAEIVLYRIDPAWGFRAAAQGYYERFPAWFTRRVPAEQEGIWVAFSDLAPIPDIDDFGIAFHELGALSQVPFDDSAGIHSFRYVAEPWSHWLAIRDADVDPTDYDQTVAYLRRRAEAGDRRAAATLVSGFHDADRRLVYDATEAPWCRGEGGCAVFTVNPDPDIEDPEGDLNKAHLEWSAAQRETYERTGLDGEYVDSFLGRATTVDLRRSHFAAADTPLAFRTSDLRVGTPQVFATTEFARWLAADVHHNLGKWTMANGILRDCPWGADLFDFMGTETNWLRTGGFVPESDAQMMYRRALSYRRPYGLLMNTDFSALTTDLVERYFQAALFYAVYPSMFSHDASSDRYWDDPALYERDRPLFRRYIPLVRELSAAGWEPLTHAVAGDARVVVERYGRWPRLYLALRNLDPEATARADLVIERQAVGLPAFVSAAHALVDQRTLPLAVDDHTARLALLLAPGATEVLRLSDPGATTACLPRLLR